MSDSSCIDGFDFMTNETTIAIIFGYLRKNGYLDYNVKWDDLIDIILKYINNKKNNIEIHPNNENIKLVDGYSINMIDSLNKQFIVAIHRGSNSPALYVNFIIHTNEIA